jgi:hypothetical protein
MSWLINSKKIEIERNKNIENIFITFNFNFFSVQEDETSGTETFMEISIFQYYW